jgi:hypothetical protein
MDFLDQLSPWPRGFRKVMHATVFVFQIQQEDGKNEEKNVLLQRFS